MVLKKSTQIFIFMCAICVPTSAISDLSVVELRDHMFRDGPVAGEFVQCTKHGRATIRGTGNFYIDPEKKIVFNFITPRKQKKIFYGNGTESKVVAGVEQPSPNPSFLSRLIFPIMSLNIQPDDPRFSVQFEGSMEKFKGKITLLNSTLGLASIVVEGNSGFVNRIDINISNQKSISIFLFNGMKINGELCV